MTLEMSDAQEARLAPSAVAATVEETIGRVASLPDEVLDNEELLEGYALEAFEQAAAANLPAVFSQATYRSGPICLKPASTRAGCCCRCAGPSATSAARAHSRSTVSPHLAEEVESFEGEALADHLQDQFGVEEGEQVEGEMYLYEALPGTQLTDIARGERETLGPGLSDEANATQLQLLTPQAAASLLGKPGLGRALPSGATGPGLAAGQRLYHLATGRSDVARPHSAAASASARQPHARRGAGPDARLRFPERSQGAESGRALASGEQPRPDHCRDAACTRPPARTASSAARRRSACASCTPACGPDRRQRNCCETCRRWRRRRWCRNCRSGWRRRLPPSSRRESARIVTATEDAADGITLAFTLAAPAGLEGVRPGARRAWRTAGSDDRRGDLARRGAGGAGRCVCRAPLCLNNNKP